MILVGLRSAGGSLYPHRVTSYPAARAGIVALMLMLVTFSSVAEALSADSPTLHVRGEAQLMVSPDQVVVTIGVVTEAKKANKALSENGKVMTKVMQALESLGIQKKGISTQNFNVQPMWSSRPKSVSSSWRSQIVGYRVNNSVQVKTTQIKLIGDIIDAASTAGANKIQSIRFGLSNPREYRSTALAQAVENARADAEATAKAAGARITEVKTIHVDQAIASVEHIEKTMVMRSMADSAPATPISAGDITVRASVSIVYELEE